MEEKSQGDKIPLTLQLSADLAKRLQAAAVAHGRSAASVAIDLLERHLPRTQPGEGKKGKIPYS